MRRKFYPPLCHPNPHLLSARTDPEKMKPESQTDRGKNAAGLELEEVDAAEYWEKNVKYQGSLARSVQETLASRPVAPFESGMSRYSV